MDYLKVSSKSSPASVAGAIAGLVKDGEPVNIQCVGAGAVNQAIKAVAIALMAQSVQDLCMEAGQTALAGRVELAGKVAVLLAAMPLFTVLTDTLLALLR